MDVEIFRRTVKDRRRGASYELLQHMAEGIRACGDNPIMVNENKTGEWTSNEMEPTAKIGCMFGYGGSNQMHHTKGRRRDLVERAKKKGIHIITFDGGILSSFGNTITHPKHHWRVSLYSPMNNGNFLSDNSPPDRWEMMKKMWNIKYQPWRKSNQDDPILFVLQPKDNWSMDELDPIEWFNGVYEKIRPITDRQFLIRPHPNHMAHIEERVKHQLLRHHAQRLPRGAPVADHIVAHHADAAAAGLDEPGNNVDQRGLARAVGSEQAKELALLDVERHAIERVKGAERLADIGNTDGRLHSRSL